MRVFVGLHRGGALFGRAVRWMTWKPYGHASLRFGDGSASDLVYEANFRKGWVRRTVSDLTGPVDWFEVSGLSSRQRVRALVRANALVGTPYDYWGVLRHIPIVRALWQRSALASRRRLFCNEGVFLVLLDVGLALLARAKPHKLSPGDLAYSPYLIEAPDVA